MAKVHISSSCLARDRRSLARSIGRTDAELFSQETARTIREHDQQVIDSGRPLILEDVGTANGVTRTYLSTKSPCWDPEGRVIGLAGIATDITARKRAEEEKRQKKRVLEQLNDYLQTCESVQEAYRVMEQIFPPIFPGLSGALLLVTPSRTILEEEVVWGNERPSARVHAPGDCWALRRGQPHQVEDVGEGVTCRHVGKQPEGPASYVCLPMMAQGEALGVFHLASREGPLPEIATRLGSMVASQCAQLISNLKLREKLRDQSIRGPLSGLFNRRYLEETLERELHRIRRKNLPLGILAIEIDHFKRFNDTFGHAAGDAVIRDVSRLFSERIRASDMACRSGGEEFTLVLPEAGTDICLRRAEEIRAAAAELRIVHRGQSLGPITISVGVAVYPDHGETPGDVLARADDALFRAKEEGRNRTVLASPLEEVGETGPAPLPVANRQN